MVISTIFYTADTPLCRSHHKICHQDLQRWMHYYEKYKSFPAVLFTDKKTKIPKFWKYDVVSIDVDMPKMNDVLNTAGVIKANAFANVGKTLILDLDTIINDSLLEIENFDCELAMADDHVPTKWDAYLGQRKKNAGVMLVNVDFKNQFYKIWQQDNPFDQVTFKDEIIFSLLTKDYKYEKLPSTYNCCDPKEQAKIYHFHGKYKNKLSLYDLPNDRITLL